MTEAAATPLLLLEHISKRFPAFALKDVCLSVNRGDYFILLGLSGAGKSMVLETIAGLTLPESGSIRLNGTDITHEKIQKRGIGIVFQDHAVFPHLTVAENIAYPLRRPGISHAERKNRVEEIAANLDISPLLNRRPSTLSGGELQRVALARALVQQPQVLLLDEPMASLDIQLKGELRSLLRRLNRQGQTIIHVTHEYEEALSLGNRLAVMHHGEVLQSGSPEEVFTQPRSEFVAHFTGARNFFRVSFPDQNGIAKINETISITISGQGEHREGYVLIRKEDIFLSSGEVETSAVNHFRGVIRDIIPTSVGYEVIVDIGIPVYSLITATSLANLSLREGGLCYVHFKASAVRFIEA